jgi:hypothetical protein
MRVAEKADKPFQTRVREGAIKLSPQNFFERYGAGVAS